MYKNKKVLVTGGTGMIGIPLVRKLTELGATVRVVSLDDLPGVNSETEFVRGDLRDWSFCKNIMKGMDLVFHLAGTKGGANIGASRTKAASFFVPHLVFNTFVMEAARLGDVDRYLYTSTIGIYGPSPLYVEDRAWDAPPEDNTRFPGWAKRMGELQAEAYKLEFGWDKIAIVRPSNVYGPFDYFNPLSSMVVPSLIHRAVSGERPLTVWGDGTAIRDFVYSEDIADGMLLALEKSADCVPINLGGGRGVTILELVDEIVSFFPGLEVRWDPTKPRGAAASVLDISRARQKLGYEPKVSLKDGIAQTIEWYRRHKDSLPEHYNVFLEGQLVAG